ncbi:MAG: hypothetical protein ACM3NH_00280 [Candidatus Saccharibacteria bacterium]
MASRDGQPPLQVGNRIWRIASTGRDHFRFERGDRGDWILRAAYSYERRAWIVAEYGMVCFCPEPTIPDNWTYFRVVRIDRKYATVTPVAGREDELLRRFGNERRDEMKTPAEECLGVA